ncbi:glycosyltransferase family 2 protein [Herbivorax sp. ANBcel31]|uniref:glycosyltransferase n=1 Tax=Herbivorax sp. ANBcel31 TaxID=3069754 RepID=UPI0027B66A53|nr:glycosyltransferase family 2 protein [Herbivorax sp. ANBcel31]MDQ2085561.1 glycosyltransferase family 2 protein [Herbivorax sp. ANBcel31]
MSHYMFTSPRTLLFIIFFIAYWIWFIIKKGEKEYSDKYNSIEAIIPAYNEEVTISRTVTDLLANDYIKNIIVVNDGSTDKTVEVLNELKFIYGDRLRIITQKNTGKAGAINNAINYIKSELVFLTDADIRIPKNNGLGYLIKAIENGADAVAGIPGSDMDNIGFFGKIRASIKIFFATFRKCGGEVLGGHPFCVSGSVGMYRTKLLKSVNFPDRTCVEDLDLTWELVSRGYKIAQSSRAIVYSQEAPSFLDDLKRWKRWISGYAVCMRIHRKLLKTRFGITIIMPNFIIGLFGAILMISPFVFTLQDALFGAIIWCGVLFCASTYSASKQGKKWWLILYSPLSIFIILTVFFCWLFWGIPSLITGVERGWNKVKRY